MVSIHSQQHSALLTTLLCATVFLSRAVSQSQNTKLPLHDKLGSRDFLSGPFSTKRNQRVEAAILASLLGQNNRSVAKRSIPETETIQKGMEVLHQQLGRALARIEEHVQKNHELAERLARSPRAIKTVKDLEADIATFSPARPITKYKVLEYAIGNKRWRHALSQHPVSIQDLLLHDIKTRQEKNKLLGEKVMNIVLENQLQVQQSSSIHTHSLKD
jgi:hypothetical protein